MLFFALFPVQACESWGPLTALSPIRSPGLAESSGVAPSLRSPGQLWTHDDSGSPELFRFGIDGTVTVHEVPAANNKDWEDIASASCGSRASCLYIADIGAERTPVDELQIYVVNEPRGDGAARLLERWELRWPGSPRDAETLLIHPCTLDAWIITRAELTEVFAIDPDRGPRATDLIPLTSLDLSTVTGGDFSPDGTGLVLRTLNAAYHWDVDPTDPGAAFSSSPTLIVDGLEPGEAITWEADGDLIVTSEGAPTPVGRLACEQPSELPVCTGPGCSCGISPTGPGPWGILALAGVGWAVGRRSSVRSPSRSSSARGSPRCAT